MRGPCWRSDVRSLAPYNNYCSAIIISCQVFLCYNFYAMKWLLILVIVFPFAKQPAEHPKDKGPAETNHANSAGHAKSAESNQTQSAQPAPTTTPSPIATEGQRSATTANDHAQTTGQQTADEDRATQRKLTWFTGVLAVVGVFQVVVMFLTWLVYRRQAREMRRQRHEMRQQRHVMWRQWRAMGQQLAEIKLSGERTDKQIAQAERQIAASERNINLFIDRERARIRIEVVGGIDIVQGEHMNIMQAKYKVIPYGPTPAVVIGNQVELRITQSPEVPERNGFPWMSSMGLPAVLITNIDGIDKTAVSMDAGDLMTMENINQRKAFVFFRGFIAYRDMFGKRQDTSFSYRWSVTDLTSFGKPEQPFSYWVKCGNEEDNRET